MLIGRARGRDMVRPLLIVLAAWLVPLTCLAAQLYDDFPAALHANERYVIYSHGAIGEGGDPRPVSPRFGEYDFPDIKRALFRHGGFNLIAYQRPKDADFGRYVETLKSWVRRLVDAGVRPSHITLVGFSRGAKETAYASSDLSGYAINTALLATCTAGDVQRDPPLLLAGNLLSIYETSDEMGSCARLATRSHLASFTEVAISTGKSHGAFYRPLPQWVQPLKAWIRQTNR